MPVYEYTCLDCGCSLEQTRSMHEPGPDSCICGGSLRRVFAPTPAVFKASGFYRTDNRK